MNGQHTQKYYIDLTFSFSVSNKCDSDTSYEGGWLHCCQNVNKSDFSTGSLHSSLSNDIWKVNDCCKKRKYGYKNMHEKVSFPVN